MAKKKKKDNGLNELLGIDNYSKKELVEMNTQGFKNYLKSVAPKKTTTRTVSAPIRNTNQSVSSKILTGTSNFNNNQFSIENIQAKQQARRQQEQTKEIGSEVGYVAKKTGLGAAKGIVGIGQSALTEGASGMKQGQNNKNMVNVVKNVTALNPITGSTQAAIDAFINLFKNDKKSVKSKATDFALDLANSPTKSLNAHNQLLGMVAPKDSYKEVLKVNDKISKPVDKIDEKLNKESKKYSKGVQTAGEIMEVVGNMVPSIGASILTKNPNVGLATMGMSAKGQGTMEALKNGEDLERATKIGTAKGEIEVGTELLTGGVKGFGKGVLGKLGKDTAEDVVSKSIVDKGISKVTEKLASKGLKNSAKVVNTALHLTKDVVGEIGEETISDILNTAIDKNTYNPDAKYSFEDWKHTAGITTASTIILNTLTNGATRGLNKIGKITDEQMQNLNVDKAYKYVEDNLNIKLTDEEKNIINGVVNEKLNNIEKQETSFEDKKLELQEQLNELKSRKIADMTVEEHNDINNSIKSLQEQIDNIDTNIVRSELFDRTARENNLNPEDSTLKSIKNLMINRGVSSSFDAKQFNNTNEDAIWRQNEDGTREVIFNPNAKTGITEENVAIHEMFHDMYTSKTGQKLVPEIIDYISSKDGYVEARKELEQVYAKDYDINSDNFTKKIDEEVVAKVLGQKLGDQDYINSLTMEKPSVARQIYNWVVDKLNKFTGSRNEKLFWTDVKNKFETALSEDYVARDEATTKYSIGGEKSIKKLADSKYKQNALNSLYEAKKMSQNGENNEDIRKKTKWFQDRNGDWKFEFDDSKLIINNKILHQNSKYKLSDIIDHDLLFYLYPDLKKYDVIFTDMKGNGSFYSPTKKISINNSFIANADYLNLKGTILHEVQHAIQCIENFEAGTTSKLSKKAYYQKLGEIEADDTKQRFLNAFDNNKREQIAPESSKTNPKHSNYNNYMKNRGKIDKVKDTAYNFVKRGVINGRKNQEIVFKNQRENNALVDGGRLLNEELDNNSSFSLDKNYRGSHQIENAKAITDLDIKDIENKVVEVDGYLTKQSESDLRKLKKILKASDEKTKIYRASPVNELNSGDWVTTDKSYAQNIANTNGGKVYEYEVKPNQLYYPDDVKSLPSLHRLSSFQYVDNTNPITNEDIRKSTTTDKFQEFLDKNIQRGKGKTIQEVAKLQDKVVKKAIAPIKEENKVLKQEVKTLKKEVDKLKVPIEKAKQKPKEYKPYLEMSKEINKNETNSEVTELLNKVDKENSKNDNVKTKPRKEGAIADFKRTTQYLFTNKNAEIDEYARETGNKNIRILADHVNNIQGEISTNINNSQLDNNGNVIGKGITEIFNQARQEKVSEPFNDYLFHKSNIARHKQGKGSVIDFNESEQLIKAYEKDYPQFKKWANEVNQYNTNLLYKQADAGLITKDLADNLTKRYDFYVPFMEDIEKDYVPNENGKVEVRNTVKNARGGADKNLLGFEEAMMRQTQSAITQIRKNQLYNEIINTKTNKSMDFEDNTNPNNFDNGLYTDGGKYYLTGYVDGKATQVEIDKNLYHGLNQAGDKKIKAVEKKLRLVTKPLQVVGNLRRNILTTWSPTFIITNPLKDLQDAPLNSKYAKDFSKNVPKAFKELFTGKGKHVDQFLNMYGQANLRGDYNLDSGLADVTKLAKTNDKAKKTNSKTLQVSKKMLKKVPQLNEIIEMAPRYAEYLASLENGTSQMEALYNAREVTTNFGRGGIITKALNRNGFTFLNASVQGFSKLVRNFSGENGAKGVLGCIAKATVLGLTPALINAVLLGDDDDYEAIPDYIKDNYYLIKTSDNNFLRIPKGRMMSIFGSAGRRTLERTEGKRPELSFKDDVKSYISNAYNQVGVQNPSESNIFAPIIQAKNNKTWYGTDLVPKRLQTDKDGNKIPTKDQYDASTDKMSIWLGSKLGISPYKINYVVDQYSGGIGDMILPTITEEAQSKSNSVIGKAIAPLKDKFTADSITDNKNVTNFYSKVEELGAKKNETGSKKDDIKYQYMRNLSFEMGSLYKEMREVQSNKKLSNSKKYAKVQNIKAEINKIAEEGMKGYKDVEAYENYARVGDRELYKYKNKKGETGWSLSDSMYADDINMLGLTVKEKNDYYTIKMKMSDTASQYTDKQGTEKYHAILNTIRKSELPSDAKYQLYNSWYGNGDDKSSYTAQDIGISANEYLKFKTKTFKADKLKNGYSVKGSKSKKITDYLNKRSNLDYGQKAVLYRMAFSYNGEYDNKYSNYYTNKYNNAIVDYVNTLDTTYEEDVSIYKSLGFKVSKNGKVTWK